MELTDHKDVNLGYAWQKYKACLAAIQTCNLRWESGELKNVFDRKPTQADIISVFKGKSQWHLTYSKAFPKVSSYPSMVSWLEDHPDKPSDLDLWGISKPAYLFSDLMEWLANGGEGLNGQESETDSDGKGKDKGKKKGKDKGRNKGKGGGRNLADKDKEEKKAGGSKDKDKGKGKETTGGKKKKSKGNL